MDCDRCGGDIGNGGLDQAGHLQVLDKSGYPQSVRWCTRACLPVVLAEDTIAARPQPIELFHPDPEPEAPQEQDEVPATPEEA